MRYEKKDDTSTAKALTLTDDKYSFTMPDYDVVVKVRILQGRSLRKRM